jgi:hypothetical protein
LPPGYFSSLLSQENTGVLEDEEAEIEVMDSPPLNEMNSQSKAKGRSKNFSEAEDILLISAYLNTSIDSITGRDQKDGKYWERIENYFHENKTFVTDRNWSSLKHRWGIINKEVSIFCGFHDSIERKNESGKTSNDKVKLLVSILVHINMKTCSFMFYYFVDCRSKSNVPRTTQKGFLPFSCMEHS